MDYETLTNIHQKIITEAFHIMKKIIKMANLENAKF